MRDFTTISIDGGAGTGKSTLSNLLSERNNYLYVETGSHYRALTCILLREGVTPENATSFVNENSVAIDSEIKIGDEVIVHHNVFRRFRDIRGKEKNSKAPLLRHFDE